MSCEWCDGNGTIFEGDRIRECHECGKDNCYLCGGGGLIDGGRPCYECEAPVKKTPGPPLGPPTATSSPENEKPTEVTDGGSCGAEGSRTPGL
jgi:hypothetical protein